MNSQQDATRDENATATGDSAPTDSEGLSNRFPDDALIPDPRCFEDVPF